MYYMQADNEDEEDLSKLIEESEDEVEDEEEEDESDDDADDGISEDPEEKA